ncbi:hypothetical protein GPECTOR_4g857 [Gonium pectorale]|uniref:Uncharacterized protein n=1 Tax=Gonium pectorale TaxID=33097 RepID=A0A150GXZ7_GONPE|nr:hypothetical protein GPECTOR_4g857 [Gonium pectorale]|eukprot:KXZ54786.1 hypothetical protein GPECTOR_4g857 [Gonium pectorale]
MVKNGEGPPTYSPLYPPVPAAPTQPGAAEPAPGQPAQYVYQYGTTPPYAPPPYAGSQPTPPPSAQPYPPPEPFAAQPYMQPPQQQQQPGQPGQPTSFGTPQPYPPPQQPPQQSPQPAALGTPVLGQQAAFLSEHPVWGEDEATRDKRLAVCAWITFALGFLMPVFWLISVMYICCLPGRHVRLAAMASTAAAVLYAVLALIMGPTMGRYRHHHRC